MSQPIVSKRQTHMCMLQTKPTSKEASCKRDGTKKEIVSLPKPPKDYIKATQNQAEH